MDYLHTISLILYYILRKKTPTGLSKPVGVFLRHYKLSISVKQVILCVTFV